MRLFSWPFAALVAMAEPALDSARHCVGGHHRCGEPEITSMRRHDTPKCCTIPDTRFLTAISRRRVVLTTGLLLRSCEDKRDDVLQRLLSNLLKLACLEIEALDATCANPALTALHLA